MKNQALFSLKDRSKKLKWRLLHFLCGALRVNLPRNSVIRLTDRPDMTIGSTFDSQKSKPVNVV